MKNTIYALTAALWLAAAVSPAHAQATRTWVSGTGDDVNPCSRTSPCKTFVGAIVKTAAGGEINVLDPGGFGALTITKSITIDGYGAMGSVLTSGISGITVNLPSASDSVVLRNLQFHSTDNVPAGIRIIGSGSVVVDRVRITQGLKGIDFQPTGEARLLVTNTIIANTGGGACIKPNGTNTVATFDGVTFERNTYGVRAEDRSIVSITNSIAAGNLNNGFLAISAGQPVQMNISHSTATVNRNPGATSSGIQSNGSQATVRISDVTVVGNDIGLNIANSGVIESWKNNYVAGNTSTFLPGTILSMQ